MTRDEALAFLEGHAKQRYMNADAVLLCGSTAMGLGTATSDLDLVVLFEQLPGGAYRETLDVGGTLVEAFCHDPGTLRYFIDVRGTPSGVPSLAAMVSAGVPVPGFSGSLVKEAKRIAEAAIAAGPPALTPSEIDHQRYTLASLLDDIDPMQPLSERVALGSALYLGIATFALRAAGNWSGNGKGLARALARHDPGLDQALAEAIAQVIAGGDTAKIEAVVDAVLTPHGGRLVAGYTARAPADWRLGN